MVAATALGLLAGCSATTDAATPATPQPSVPSAPAAPAPSPSAGDAEPAPQIPDCSVVALEGVDATLSQQLAAFAERDFRSAFALASESFRASVDLKGFRAIILDGYPEVAASTSHRILECRQPAPSSVSALVVVTGANGVAAQLGYRFVLEPGGWRVDGASTLATAAPQTA
jgi:hypothetical protein